MSLPNNLPPIPPLREWTVFAPVSEQEPLPAASLLSEIPDYLDTSNGRLEGTKVLPIRNQVNLQPFFGPLYDEASFGNAAYVFVPLSGQADEELTLGFGGDYHLQLWFNGEAIYQSPETGETACPPSIRDHQAVLRLRSGRNILAVRLLGGRGGAVLALGCATDSDCRSILNDPLLTQPGWSRPRLEARPRGKSCLEMGSRRELFLDDFLIDEQSAALSLRLHHPVPREVVAEFGKAGKPWETGRAGYPSFFRTENHLCMVYAAAPAAVADESPGQFACLMESEDGIHFTRPELNFFEYQGQRKNNIIWQGRGGHNFFPFVDAHPSVAPDQRYKAVAYHPEGRGLAAYGSADGYQWRLLAEHKILSAETNGRGFDSQNVAFYDSVAGCYVCYFRNVSGGLRRIKRATSHDFLHWRDEGEIAYEDSRTEHLYINAIQPYHRAPHLLIGTPARFMPYRKKVPSHPLSGISDTLLMSSRDGRQFRRWEESFFRPGIEPEVWTDRNNFCAPGFLQLVPEEMSLYWTEHQRHSRPRIRRGTLRTDGFASLHAPGGAVGEILTRPLLVEGNRLEVNYSTSAAGSLLFEICDEHGTALPGFSLSESDTLYGNEIAHDVCWRDRVSTLPAPDLADRPIRLRIRMQDADLFSLRFVKV